MSKHATIIQLGSFFDYHLSTQIILLHDIISQTAILVTFITLIILTWSYYYWNPYTCYKYCLFLHDTPGSIYNSSPCENLCEWQIKYYTVCGRTVLITESLFLTQLEKFRHLHEGHNTPLVDNFRDPQPINGRTIYRSFPHQLEYVVIHDVEVNEAADASAAPHNQFSHIQLALALTTAALFWFTHWTSHCLMWSTSAKMTIIITGYHGNWHKLCQWCYHQSTARLVPYDTEYLWKKVVLGIHCRGRHC